MPQLDFDPKHKTEQTSDFPRLKLDAGERARILGIEQRPTYAYVHTLRAPKIVNGVAEKKQIERKDGSTYTDYVKDFIGRPLCLGDLGILADKGVDPRNCPVCARSTETSEVDAPQRRFAMHVIQYQVKPNSFDLRAPFGCELVVWSFTDQIYNKLVDISSEWGSLREHDLLLGPCTNKDFQKFEIMVANSAAWMLDERIKQIVVETYRENKLPDLEQFCGRKVERRWMEDDLEKIAARWRIANGTPDRVDGTERAGAPSLTEGLTDLLGGQPAAAKPTSAPPAVGVLPDAVDLGDLLGGEPAPGNGQPAAQPTAAAPAGLDFADLLGSGEAPAPAAAPAAPAPAAKPAAAEQPAATVDFDDLLNSLG